jgi:hypothetical protein
MRPPLPPSGPRDATATSPDPGPTRPPPPLLPDTRSLPWSGPRDAAAAAAVRTQALRGCHHRSQGPTIPLLLIQPCEAAAPTRREVTAIVGAPRCHRRHSESRPCEDKDRVARWLGDDGGLQAGVRAGGGGGMLQATTGGRQAASRVLQAAAVVSTGCKRWRGERSVLSPGQLLGRGRVWAWL